MSTPIWADNVVVPFRACGKCPLPPTVQQIRDELLYLLSQHLPRTALDHARWTLDRRLPVSIAPGTILHQRHAFVADIIAALGMPNDPDLQQVSEMRIERLFSEHRPHARSGTCRSSPLDCRNVRLLPAQMIAAAALPSLQGMHRPIKEWLRFHRRVIHIEGFDAILRSASYESIRDQLLGPVSSPDGSRHIWLLQTEVPDRLAAFYRWLSTQGAVWPGNVVPIVVLASKAAEAGARAFSQLNIPCKGVHLEPMAEGAAVEVTRFDWVIVGGGNDALAAPFRVESALYLKEHCRRVDKALFVTQAGCNPELCGQRLKLRSKIGTDWKNWPSALRVRIFPRCFRHTELPDNYLMWLDHASPWVGNESVKSVIRFR